MFNPLTRTPRWMKRIYRGINGMDPDMVGVFSDGTKFDFYITDSSEDRIAGVMDYQTGLLKFEGVRNDAGIRFTAKYASSCLRKGQKPMSIIFDAKGEDILEGKAESENLLLYNFRSGCGLMHRVERPFAMGGPESIEEIVRHASFLPPMKSYETVSYCH